MHFLELKTWEKSQILQPEINKRALFGLTLGLLDICL